MPNTIVLKTLSILLGIFFIFLGVIKLTPAISKELHKDMRKEFVKYTSVFPMATALGFKLPSKWYRRVFGGLEIVCGIVMAAVPSQKFQRFSNIILLMLTVLSVYSHFFTDDKFERTAPSLVMFFMTGCRFIIDYQQERRRLAEAVAKKKE